MKRAKGLTRIDVLAGLTVVAALVLIVPMLLGTATENSRQAKCLSNLSQLGRAIFQFASIHNDWLPAGIRNTGLQLGSYAGEWRADPLWYHTLANEGLIMYSCGPPVTDSMLNIQVPRDHILKCPSDSAELRMGLTQIANEASLFENPTEYSVVSYSATRYVLGVQEYPYAENPDYPPWSTKKLSSLPGDLGTLIMLGERGASDQLGGGNIQNWCGYMAAVMWAASVPGEASSADKADKGFWWILHAPRTRFELNAAMAGIQYDGSCAFLLCDGHAEIQTSDITYSGYAGSPDDWTLSMWHDE